ncbi:hypothetical protein, partial [Streptomyces stramineus]|uniref:hypothetical protein n=1 Tax=Streptomyces stramineus TaxID=173861 RepID=UPI003CD082F5
MVGETVVIRGLAAAAAAAAVVGAVLMRRWDQSAGKRVAQLTAARTREEWKTEERIAELETELEEARAARSGAETKLRGKRSELARLRTEHADLLRRYAAAETGRARALEGRRLAQSPGLRSVKELGGAASGPAGPASAYRAAAEALHGLERKAGRRQPQSPAEVNEPKRLNGPAQAREGDEPALRPVAATGVPRATPALKAVEDPAPGTTEDRAPARGEEQPAAEPAGAPAARV